MQQTARVFISSTSEDLQEYRQEVKNAALKTGILPVMFEHWPAAGHRQPLEACLRTVAECDILIVIVAHRYGWVPPAHLGTHKSVTWLECEEAVRHKKEVIAFLVEDDAPWPIDEREEYQAVRLVQRGVPTVEEMTLIRRSVEQLQCFKQWLSSLGVRARFRNSADLRGEVIAALNDWRLRNTTSFAEITSDVGADPTRYLRYVFEQTRYIEIRGLQVGSGRAHQFPIEELYIALKFKGESQISAESTSSSEQPELEALLRNRRVVILGDPGGGKTTLLRRIAHSLAAARLGLPRDAARQELGVEGEAPLPIFIRLADIGNFIDQLGKRLRELDIATQNSPEWLIKFLVKTAHENAWGLDEQFYRQALEHGTCVLLLDGLDETPSVRNRILISQILVNCAHAYERTQFLVTSRPKAYTAETSLTSFRQVEVEALTESAIQLFLRRWCEALFSRTPEVGAAHHAELERALLAKPEIRRMAKNPVMLTALAVVHWNERRIPEQRTQLYESIITWLSRAREDRPGRETPERCVRLLQMIALGMQDHPTGGRQVEVPRRWAAERIMDAFPQSEIPIDAAERFVADEELDSGIIVARGENVRFWHLSFQEFLAARAIAAFREDQQGNVLLGRRQKLLSSEWREIVLLLAGILHQQGTEKVRLMLETLLNSVDDRDPIAIQAQVVGLLGGILRDLASLQFRFQKDRYTEMQQRVMEVFKPSGADRIPFATRLEAADALGQGGDIRLSGDTWIALPAGDFLLGAQAQDCKANGYDACALSSDTPVRSERVSAFRIGRFLVTVAEYERFLAEEGYRDRSLWVNGGFERWQWPDKWEAQIQYPNRPVVGISWYEAMAYCRWRGEGISLPTEIQWERAARGNMKRIFPWGDESPDETKLNFRGQGVSHVTPVGFFPLGATPEGALDMAGNVFQWCLNAWPYDRSSTAQADSYHIVRGGCYQSVALFVRASFRGRYPSHARKDFIGFRIVVES